MIDETRILRKRDVLPINDEEFGIHVRRNERIVDRKVELGTGRACDQFTGCSFIDCEICIRCGGRMTSVATLKCDFEDCLIWPRKKQIIPSWEADFSGCLFKGKFEVRFDGIVQNCDFRRSVLNYAKFHQEESLGEVFWPEWPHIVVDSPKSNYAVWKELAFPQEFNRLLVRAKGIAAVINLSDAVEDPQAMWDIIKDQRFVSTYLQDGESLPGPRA